VSDGDISFGPDFALVSGGVFDFYVGPGEYDYCISDLEFLNEDGDPVSD